MAANAEGGTREQKLEPRPVEEEEEEKVTPTHIISMKQNETRRNTVTHRAAAELLRTTRAVSRNRPESPIFAHLDF